MLTEGEWGVTEELDGTIFIESTLDGDGVTTMCGVFTLAMIHPAFMTSQGRDEAMADARAMAAAKDLPKVAQRTANWLARPNQMDEEGAANLLADLDAAIDKAAPKT